MIKQKNAQKKNQGRKPSHKPSVDGLSKPAVAGFTFFLLEQKEPKIQDKPDPSGRFVWPLRTWVATVLAATVLVVIVDPSFG